MDNQGARIVEYLLAGITIMLGLWMLWTAASAVGTGLHVIAGIFNISAACFLCYLAGNMDD